MKISLNKIDRSTESRLDPTPYLLTIDMSCFEDNLSGFSTQSVFFLTCDDKIASGSILWLHLTPDDLEKLHAALHQEVTL